MEINFKSNLQKKVLVTILMEEVKVNITTMKMKVTSMKMEMKTTEVKATTTMNLPMIIPWQPV